MRESSEKQGVRGIIEEFINIYRDEPCLWQIKSEDYHRRDKKNAAYNKLIEVYRKLEPNANREAVVRKLNALRTNYRKEKRKVEESIRSGADTSDVYEPKLWYFELLKFLDDDHGTTRFIRTYIDEVDINSQLSQETESALHSQDMHDNSSETGSTSEQISRARPPKRKSTDSTDLSNFKLHFNRPVLQDDRFDIFGKHVAIKMRELPPQQRLIAEKIINDTLFQAELGNLTLPQKEYQQHEFIYAGPFASSSPRHIKQYIDE